MAKTVARGATSSLLRTLTARHVILLAAVLAIVLGTWAFIGLLDNVQEGESQRFDSRLVVWCYHHRGPQALQDVGRDLTALGGITVLSLVTLAVTGFLLISHKRGAAMLVIVATGGGLGFATLIKQIVHRERPPRMYQSAYVFTNSFPSGHSMLSAITYLTIGALLAQVFPGLARRIYIISVAILVTLLVGISRVYLGVHWPTDVLAGWTAGLVWAILCLLVAHELQRRGAVEQEEPALTSDED